MSLLDALDVLGPKLDRYERAQNVQDLLADYRRVNENLAKRAAASARVRKRLQALAGNEFVVILPNSPAQADRLATVLTPILTNFRQDADSVCDPAPERWKELEDAEDQLSQHVKVLYDRAVQLLKGEALPLFYDLLATAQDFPGDSLARVKTIDADLAELLPESPTEKAATLKRARALKEERDGLLEKLRKTVPAEMRELLQKIRGGTATLADLTPKRLEWMQHKGLAAGFRIDSITLVEPGRPA
jgi:hypothetical protein